jgi:hypothetical protein
MKVIRYVASVLLSCTCLLHAQEFRATVTGYVSDSSGARMAGVALQAKNLGTNETAVAVTNAQGVYKLPLLPPGTYRVAAEAKGFKQYVREKLVLNVGDTIGVDITMEVGRETEAITVLADTQSLETENADHGLVIDEKRVSELPLNARNPFMLSILAPGVTYNGNQIYQRPFDNGAIADWVVNGGLDRKNEFLLDGAPNNAQAGGNNIAYVPPVDSVQEFKIQTNSFDASFGKSSGGIMNVTLKGGTNQFHGTGYEFMRRNPLDANSFQNNAAGIAKSGHFLDQYGASIGGPLIFPKIYNGRNKSFFFVNYEGYREGTPTPLILSVPRPEFLTGDFSRLVDSKGAKITIYDPLNAVINPDGSVTRQAFANNIIPSSRLNPISQKLLGYFGKPNTTTPGSAYSNNDLFIPGGSSNLDRDSFYNLVTKFDFNITDKHHVFFREASNDRTEHRNTNGALGAGFQGPDPLKRINDAYVLDWSGVMTPTLVIGARVSVARYVEGSRSDDNIGFPLTSLGFPSSLAAQLPQSNLFGQYNFSNYTGLGSNVFSFNYTNTKSAAFNVTKILGSHTVKAGVDLRWIDFNVKNYGNAFLLTFDNTWTQQVYNKGDSASGNSFASALLGLPSGGSVDNFIFPAYTDKYFAGFVQDDWKVGRKLTVNLGLRWDFIHAPTERYSRLARGFDPNATSPLDSQIDRKAFPGFPTLKGGLLYAASGQSTANLDLTGIQPRIGLAYQITPKIVFRGGFGRYMINPNNDNLRIDGYSITTSLINSPDGGRTPNANLLTNPYPTGILTGPGKSRGLTSLVGQNISFFNPTFKTPYTNQMNFGFQMQLPLNSKLDVSYVGNFGHKLQTDRQYNEPTLAFRQSCDAFEGGAAAPCNALQSNPFFGNPLFAGTGLGSNATTSKFQLSRPFPQFGSINELGRNDGRSWYDALQVNYGIRATKGWNLTFGYTWSKSIEQGGFDGSNGNNANQAFMDVQRFIPERSITGFDHPHVLKISSVYELPFGRGRMFAGNVNKWTDALIGGWQHTMILQYSSGLPWNLPGNVVYVRNASVVTNWHSAVVQGVNPCIAKMSDTGTIALQPFSVGVAGCSLSTYNFLELPTFAPTRGSPLRTADIRLAATPQVDMSIGKTYRFNDRMSFQFRVEAFNVFNSFWPNTNQFANNPDSANFGQLVLGSTSQGAANFPRQIQLGFKFIF